MCLKTKKKPQSQKTKRECLKVMCIHRSDVHVAKTHAVEFRETFVDTRIVKTNGKNLEYGLFTEAAGRFESMSGRNLRRYFSLMNNTSVCCGIYIYYIHIKDIIHKRFHS